MAAERNLEIDFLEHSVAVLGALHGSQNVAGGDGADSDFRGEFEGHRLGEFDHACLGGVVIRIEGLPDEAVGGGGLENHAAAPLPHVARGGLGHVENSGQVHGEDAVPFVGGDVDEIVSDGDAGVVDEHVDRTHEADGFGKGTLDLVEPGDVSGDRAREFRKLALNFGAALFIAVEDNDAGAFFQEASCRGCADAAGASGDEDTFVLQTSHVGLLGSGTG